MQGTGSYVFRTILDPVFGGLFAAQKCTEKGMSVTQKIKSVIEKVIWMTDFIMSFTEKVIWLPKMQSQALKSPFPSLTL